MTLPYEVKNERRKENEVDKIFIDRWSPRAISNKDFTEKDLMTLFEAARWTASSSNIQPWRFLYAMHGTKDFDKYFDFLMEFNQMWTKNAGALIVLISKNNTANKEGKEVPDPMHSFSAGSALTSFLLQARIKNLVAHGMGGFDKDKAKKELNIPNDYTVEAMIAVGTQGNIEDLPERMQKSEKPNQRKPLKEIIMKGSFKKGWR
jgi:nitroreductase